MISGVFGLPGAGKSLFLGKIANMAINDKDINAHGLRLSSRRHYDYVYTNFFCNGAYKLDYDKLGDYDYHDCLILVDEIMLLSDSRNYKSFSDNLKLFYSEHRKRGCDFIYASQGYKDVDLKIRQRTRNYYYVEESFLKFSAVRRIDFFFDVANGTISDGYQYAPRAYDYYFWRPSCYDFVDTNEIINGNFGKTPLLEKWEITS